MKNAPCPSPTSFLAALAACAVLSACVLNPVADARKQFEAGQYEEALATLEKLYRDDPSNLSARSEYFRAARHGRDAVAGAGGSAAARR